MTKEDQKVHHETIHLHSVDHDKKPGTPQQSLQNPHPWKKSLNISEHTRKRKRQTHERELSDLNGGIQQQLILAQTQARNKALEYDLALQRRKHRVSERSWIESRDDLVQQLAEARVQIENLHFRLDVEESARKESTKKVIEDTIISDGHHHRQRYSETKLRHQLSVFARLQSDSFRSPHFMEFERQTQQMKYLVKQTIFSDDHPRLIVPALERHQPLARLFVPALGMDPPLQLEPFATQLESLSSQAVIRALFASALRDWVFHSSFPNFAHAESTVLFTELKERNRTVQRSLIQSHDSSKDLDNSTTDIRNLNLGTHDSMLRHPRFKDFTVPLEANRLANKLSFELAPLFAPLFPFNPEASEAAGFETWNEDSETWAGRRARFEDAFQLALTLKAQSMLSSYLYEVVLYPPGSAFNNETMEAESMDGCPLQDKNCKDRSVRLCIFGAIVAYAREKVDWARVKDVDYENFVNRGEKHRSGAEILTKAVVVLD